MNFTSTCKRIAAIALASAVLGTFGAASASDAALDGILITSLPASSALTCGGRALLRGEGVPAEALSELRLDGDGAGLAYRPVYADGTLGDEAAGLPAVRTNTSPIAREMTLATYRGIALTGTLSGIDPDGDALTCSIVEAPARGVLTLADDGVTYLYTPYQGETGRDRFTFTVSDPSGAVSAPAEVSITIEKPQTSLVYADLQGHPAHYAAIRLAEEGVYAGPCVGGRHYLEPEAVMTRGEFLSMAVAVSGREMVPAVNTSFSDDDAIPVWVKPFAVTAMQAGIAKGMESDAGRMLGADAPITRAEAAVMLDAAAGLQDAAASLDDAVPAWAQEAWRNTATLGVLAGGDASATLTRGEAVQAVYRAWVYANEAKATGGFFGWIG